MVKLFFNIFLYSFLLFLFSCTAQLSDEDFLSKVTSLYNDKDYNKAEILIKNHLVENKQSNDVRAVLASILTKKGNYEEALHQFKRANLAVPLDDSIEHILESFYFMGENNQAIEFFKEANKEEILNISKSHFIYALMRLRELQDPAHMSALSELPSTDSSTESDKHLLVLAKSTSDFYNDKQVDKYIEQLETLYAMKSIQENDWLVTSLLASLLYSEQQYSAAATVFEQFSVIRPEYFPAHLFLASSLVKSNQFVIAKPLVNRILKASPTQPIANQLKAFIDVNDNNIDAAKLAIETSINEGFASRQNLLLAGTLNFQLENYEQAISHLQKGTNGLASGSRFHKMLAFSRAKTGQEQDLSNQFDNQTVDSASELEQLKAIISGFTSSGNTAGINEIFNALRFNEDTSDALKLEYELLKQSNNVSNEVSLVDISKKLLGTANFHKGEYEAQKNNAKLVVISNLMKNGDENGAIRQVKQWIADEPEVAVNAILLAEIYKEQDRFNDIVNTLEPIALSGQNYRVFELLSGAYIKLNELDKALDSAKSAIVASPINIDLLKQYAYLVNFTDVKIDKDWPRTVFSKHAENETQAIILAMYYAMIKDYPQAELIITEYAPEQDTSALYRYTLIETLLANGSKQQAKKEAILLTKESNIPVNTVLPLANILVQMDELDIASTYLKSQVKAYPTNAPITIFLASVLHKNNQQKDALVVLNDIKVKSERSILLESELLVSTGKIKESFDLLKESYKKFKTDLIALAVARLENSMGSTDKALATLKTHNQFNKKAIVTRLLEASLLEDRLAAIPIYNEILAIIPDNMFALNDLAWALHQLNRNEEALPYAEKASKLYPENKDVADTLLQIRKALSEKESA